MSSLPPEAISPAQREDDCGQSLLLRHRSGDATAFAELVQLFRCRVYSYIIRSGVPVSISDDLFQEVFLKVHTAAHTYNPSLPFDPWFFTVVANSVRTHFRRRAVHERIFSSQSVPEERCARDLEELSVAHETAEWVESQITTLPLAQREVLNLSLAGFALPDIAEILSLPLGTVKTNIRRARLALAAAISRRTATINRESAQ